VAGFHTDARKAARLRTEPGGWMQEFDRTRHVARLLSDARFEEPACALDARGGRLASLSGNGWIACGDAAMCFDPIWGQGIFSALHSGYASGLAVIGALNRGSEKLDEYSSRMNDVWNIYQRRLQTIYRTERRWPSADFWSCER
jgi:flavin-dependent dehydrogenase